MFYILISLILSSVAISKECHIYKDLSEIKHQNDSDNFLKKCRKLPQIKDQKELSETIEFFFDTNRSKLSNDRHKSTQNLQTCKPNRESKALIIGFEGTGAYEPIASATMSAFNKCFAGKVPEELRKKVYPSLTKIYKTKMKKEIKWSGLQSGIQKELSLIENGENVDWFSFPSEEVEQLAGIENLRNVSLSQLLSDMKSSIASNPKGINNARKCLLTYISNAQMMNIRPKIILTSHSSGARSRVKFAEHIKIDLGIKIDLAFTIDPVIEAHHALEEVLLQKITEPTRYLVWRLSGAREEDYPYSAVKRRNHSKKLYAPSNIDDFQSFYQTSDREGLKIGGDLLRFGIRGSDIYGAENHKVQTSATDAHGPIAYDKEVIKAFRSKLNTLLNN
jgi:hypothetical protein